MTITIDRPTTTPQRDPRTREVQLRADIRMDSTVALEVTHQRLVRDLRGLALLCDPGDWPEYAEAWAHEVVLIEAELWARGVTPPPRPM